MELRHLKTFKTIVDRGGYTRAAEYLGYAQSTVTVHIKDIEEEIGQPLFNRLGKKMVLTETGKHLLPYVNEMLELFEKAKQLPSNAEAPSGNLVIGAPESLTVYRLPLIIREYKEKYPRVKITLKCLTCWQLIDELKQGGIDVALLLETEREQEELHIETLITEPMMLILPCNHPLNFSVEETFLYTERGCSYRAFFENYLLHQGIRPEKTLESWSVESIKQSVMCGLGISLLPIITVEEELKENKIQGLLLDEAKVNTQLAYHKNKWLSPAITLFLSLVRKHSTIWKERNELINDNKDTYF